MLPARTSCKLDRCLFLNREKDRRICTISSALAEETSARKYSFPAACSCFVLSLSSPERGMAVSEGQGETTVSFSPSWSFVWLDSAARSVAEKQNTCAAWFR